LSKYEIIRAVVAILFTMGVIALISWLFGKHFVRFLGDIIKGPEREFKTLAGIISFVGLIGFIYLILHGHTLEYLFCILAPENERMRILEHMSNTRNMFIWGGMVALVGNFLLLGFLSKS